MKMMFGGRVGSAENEPQRHRGHREKNTEKRKKCLLLLCVLLSVSSVPLWFVFMFFPLLRFPTGQQEFDDVGEVLLAHLFLEFVGHERLAGRLHRFNLGT